MPFIDGLSLTKQAMELYPDLKTIIISAHEDFSYAKTAITLGVREYLLKPIDPKEFQSVINSLLLHMREDAALQAMQVLQTDYIKNHLILQTINGETVSDTGNSQELLLNNYFSSFHTMLLIELKQELFGRSDCHPEAYLKELTSDRYYYLNLTPSLSLVLFDENCLSSSSGISGMADYLVKQLENALHTAVRISYGFLPSPSCLRQIYEKLEELLENAFLYPKRTVFPLALYKELQDKQAQGAFSAISSSAGSKISDVKHYIYQHYDSDLSLEALAARIYVHPDYLSRLFKKETGCNLNQFIKKYRMDKAKELLITTHMKISSVGAAVGYSNSSYFCKTFNDYFGITPERFREKKGDL